MFLDHHCQHLAENLFNYAYLLWTLEWKERKLKPWEREAEAPGDKGELPEDRCHGHRDIAPLANTHPSLQESTNQKMYFIPAQNQATYSVHALYIRVHTIIKKCCSDS